MKKEIINIILEQRQKSPKVLKAKQFFKNCVVTGSYIFGVQNPNDIDILIMREDLPDLSLFDKFNKNCYYETFKNSESFKIQANNTIYNIIVFDNRNYFNDVVLATNKFIEYIKENEKAFDLIQRKESRILLFEYILDQIKIFCKI